MDFKLGVLNGVDIAGSSDEDCAVFIENYEGNLEDIFLYQAELSLFRAMCISIQPRLKSFAALKKRGFVPSPRDVVRLGFEREQRIREVIDTYGAKLVVTTADTTFDGYTALHFACRYAQDEGGIRELVAAGADVNQVTQSRLTPAQLVSVNFCNDKTRASLLQALQGSSSSAPE